MPCPVRVAEESGSSNPPGTVSRPLPDLKSGRPTGDASPPSRASSAPSRGKRSSRRALTRRRSPRRMVTPWRSRNSRIWIATLRPLSSRSRNSAALNRPTVGVELGGDRRPSRRRCRAGRSGRARPRAPGPCGRRACRGGAPRPRAGRARPARSRTRGGRKRAAPPISGTISSHSSSSSGDRRTSWPGSRTQAPSSATRPARACGLQQRGEGRRGQARLERGPQALHADADEVGVLGMEGLERGDDARAAAGRRSRATSRAAGRAPRCARCPSAASASAAKAAVAGEGVGVEVVRRPGEQRRERRRGVGDRVRVELGEALGRAAAAGGRAQVEEAAAADRAPGAGVADHEAVAGERRDRAVEHELDRGRVRPGAIGVAEQHHPRRDLGRAVVQVDRQPLADRPGLAGEHLRGGRRCGRRARAAPAPGSCRRGGARPCVTPVAGEVERAAVARAAALGLAVLGVQAADADRRGPTGWRPGGRRGRRCRRARCR